MLNLEGYYLYPFGKGSTFVSNVKLQKDKMEDSYNKVKEDIECKLYLYKNNTAIYHIVIPSQSNDAKSYDVVLEIPIKDDTDLKHISFKTFSNSPSFIFTYANVFRSKSMLCRWLIGKYDEKVRNKTAETKNMYGVIGIERSLYLATMYILKNNLSNVEEFKSKSRKITNYKPVLDLVRSQDQIMEKKQDKITKSDVEYNPVLNTKIKPTKDTRFTYKKSGTVKDVKNVKQTKSVKSSKSVSKSKSVKTTKKI